MLFALNSADWSIWTSHFFVKNGGKSLFFYILGTMKCEKNTSGFTLVEVMIVIVIMGVLAGIAVPKLFGIVERSRENIDRLKLFYLREALNRALIENENALSNSEFAQSNSKKLDSLLSAETGVALFVIEMKKTASVNVQAEHNDANKDANMCRLIGTEGTWYDALNESGFEGVADIVKYRLDTKNNGNIKEDVKKNGKSRDTFTIKEDGSNYRTYPNNPMFISQVLNTGVSGDLKNNKNQGGSKTNYRLTMSIQWTGGDPNSHSVEVALLPNGGKMRESDGEGEAFLSEHGVCFSTYGDIGCAGYNQF